MEWDFGWRLVDFKDGVDRLMCLGSVGLDLEIGEDESDGNQQ